MTTSAALTLNMLSIVFKIIEVFIIRPVIYVRVSIKWITLS